MHRLNLISVIVALALPSPALAEPWDIDSAHASANFSVRHMMVSEVHGTLGEVKGTIELDDADLTRSQIEATVDVVALSTKNKKRDDHLRSEAFFHAGKFPSLSFKSTKVERVSDDKLRVTGDLTIRGTTKPVILETALTPEVQNPFSKAATRGAVATATINREDFGLVWNMALANNGVLVGHEVKIKLELEYVKRGPKPSTATK
jgi:polyisoprenoid-binding protein YceI